jgi:hypothetical protein
MFINFIPDDIFLMIRNELQKELRTISLIRGDEPKRSFRISDLTGEMGGTIDSRNVIDRLRRLMGIVENNNIDLRPADTVDNNINPVVRRRITQFPQVNIPNLGDYLSDSDILLSNPSLNNYIGSVDPYQDQQTEQQSEEIDVRRRITDNPRNINVGDYMTYFTGGTINY